MPESERFNRVLEERARCYVAMLPFDVLPEQMAIHLVITVVFCINAFAWQGGVPKPLSPMTLVGGVALDYNKHFHAIFGEYLHTYEETTNGMDPRTVEAIALGPSGNLQGGMRCYSLVPGKVLQRAKKDATIMEMPQGAIRRIKFRYKKEQKDKKDKKKAGLGFSNRNKIVGMVGRSAITTGVNDAKTADENENDDSDTGGPDMGEPIVETVDEDGDETFDENMGAGAEAPENREMRSSLQNQK